MLCTDWVKDAVHERQRKSALQSMNKNSDSWRSWWALTFESAQTWIVISLVGELATTQYFVCYDRTDRSKRKLSQEQLLGSIRRSLPL